MTDNKNNYLANHLPMPSFFYRSPRTSIDEWNHKKLLQKVHSSIMLLLTELELKHLIKNNVPYYAKNISSTLYVYDLYDPTLGVNEVLASFINRSFASETAITDAQLIHCFVNASWNYGRILYIPARARVTLRIEDFFTLELVKKLIIVVAEGAEVVIYNTYTAFPDLQTQAIDFFISPSAHLTYIVDHHVPIHVRSITSLRIYLQAYSSFTAHSLMTGCASTHVFLNVILEGKGAQADIFGACLLNKNGDMCMTTTQYHAAASTRSSVTMHTALFNESTAYYNGMIHINTEGKNTEAHQQNKVLLLNTMVSALSIPNIEVRNNEVVCTHGSAIGKLDEEMIFYAQTRGISYQGAYHILLEAFFIPLLKVHFTDENYYTMNHRLNSWLLEQIE